MKYLSAFIFLFCLGCKEPNVLPVLNYKIDTTGKKTVYLIEYDGFTNQSGQSFSTENIKNKVFIANFFFTRCPSICPPMRTQLIQIAEHFDTNHDFMIVSHTIDTEHDTTSVLMDYSEATGIPQEKWQFLRSDSETTKRQAELFMTNFKPGETGTDFYHSSYVALVDKQQQIRGFYNILSQSDIERLKEDIGMLIVMG